MNIEVYTNDKQYELEFSLTNSDGSVVDITDTTILLKAQHEDENSLSVSGSMEIIDGASGTCKYRVAEEDFEKKGVYYAEIEVTYTNGQIITFGDITVTAKNDLPK
jgi:hypothetical protein